MKNKKIILYGMAIVLTTVVYFLAQAQPKSSDQRVSFSGEWKAKESISMGGNIVCTYNPGDRMLAKTMKITEHANALNIEVASSFADEAPVKGVEKLSFDGKQSEIDLGHGKGKKFTAKLSADGRTVTINSVVHFRTSVPYKVKVYKQAVVNVTEVWKLSNDGKSITVQANAKANLFSEGRLWTTVFNKVG